MNAVSGHLVGRPPRTVGRAGWFLFGLHVTLLAVGPILTIAGFDGDPGNPAVVLLVALAIGVLQLRHSFAAARGRRPDGWPWTLLALVLLVYLPMVRFTWDWAPMQYFVVASALMVLRGWPAAIVIAAPIIGSAAAGVQAASVVGLSAAHAAFHLPYWIAGLVAGAMALYGSARLVWMAEELHATRVELAELAIGRERLRVSRDLHDLLGQSLSAVSLKGDLARRLLHRDPVAARAEIEGLTRVARDALRGMRAVARDQHAVSLRRETDAAAALLSAAGVQASVDLDLPELPQPVEAVLAWAVREGATNVLRHSEAGACRIGAGLRDGRVRLEIVNDGARPPTRGGSGLAGLGERARALSGSVSSERTRDGRFRLAVELPLGVP
jgi:two-component system, NarL family, sensor histidine kinase DesK